MVVGNLYGWNVLWLERTMVEVNELNAWILIHDCVLRVQLLKYLYVCASTGIESAMSLECLPVSMLNMGTAVRACRFRFRNGKVLQYV